MTNPSVKLICVEPAESAVISGKACDLYMFSKNNMWPLYMYANIPPIYVLHSFPCLVRMIFMFVYYLTRRWWASISSNTGDRAWFCPRNTRHITNRWNHNSNFPRSHGHGKKVGKGRRIARWHIFRGKCSCLLKGTLFSICCSYLLCKFYSHLFLIVPWSYDCVLPCRLRHERRARESWLWRCFPVVGRGTWTQNSLLRWRRNASTSTWPSKLNVQFQAMLAYGLPSRISFHCSCKECLCMLCKTRQCIFSLLSRKQMLWLVPLQKHGLWLVHLPYGVPAAPSRAQHRRRWFPECRESIMKGIWT